MKLVNTIHLIGKKFITFSFLFFSILVNAQNNTTFSSFCNLSRPEKYWVVLHPFIAKKTLNISNKILQITDSIAKTDILDGDKIGGQVDAFRHAYWMAALVQQINRRKAINLGKAHEKGNYIDFKKHRLEEGIYPDKASCDMDLFNNKIGAELGKANKKTSQIKLQQIIIDTILVGEMKIIRKNKYGKFLDGNGNEINSDSLKGKWNNGKYLVNSNYN